MGAIRRTGEDRWFPLVTKTNENGLKSEICLAFSPGLTTSNQEIEVINNSMILWNKYWILFEKNNGKKIVEDIKKLISDAQLAGGKELNLSGCKLIRIPVVSWK